MRHAEGFRGRGVGGLESLIPHIDARSDWTPELASAVIRARLVQIVQERKNKRRQNER